MERCPHGLMMWKGITALVIGVVFLLQKWNVLPEGTWSWVWPVLLVLWGLGLLYFTGSGHCCEVEKK